ncbi:MAG: DNA internalization-related competence protein ComEC/Rec2 [Gammaproteobacteria bacterium]
MHYKAGMFVYALAFLLGVVFVQQLSVLPSLSLSVVLLLSLILLYLLFTNSKYISACRLQITLIFLFIGLILLGILVSSFYAKQQLSYRLDEGLIGKNLLVNGFVSSIPASHSDVQRFEFIITELSAFKTDGSRINLKRIHQKTPRKIRLSWYYGRPVRAGEKWQLEVRLKPPHGFMNPGGFDYEAWLFQHGIDATGYVRKSALNQRQPDVPLSLSLSALMQPINKIRQSLSQKIETIAANTLLSNQPGIDYKSDQTGSFSLIKALAIGDKSSISNQQWRVLTNTGTSHLMAISGLHIGLAAFFAYLLIRRLVPAFVMKRIPAQHIALSGGLLVALLYAMVAGLSIPTQRAIIMLFVLSVMMLIRRNHRPLDALGFALVLVLLLDPLAVLSVGFWFSFSAVAVIFITLNSSRPGANNVLTGKSKNAWYHLVWFKVSSVLKQWIRLQLLITVFLLPLSLFMFQQVSLVSPVANLLLIPYVSFLVVPVVLVGIVCVFVLPGLAEVLFRLAASLLDFIWPLLTYLAELPYALWVRGDVDIVKLLLLTMAMLLLYFSRELSCYIESHLRQRNLRQINQQRAVWSLRFIACVLFFPLFITTKPTFSAGEYQLTVLDVGQGSAAVIQTENHVAVFDAGAKFSDKLDAGSSVVLPYLRSQGIQFLDYLIISHGDADHIGGAQVILDAHPETSLIGQDIEKLVASKKQACVAGDKWQWDGVDFVFLSPATAGLSNGNSSTRHVKRNNQSCVLKVSSTAGSVLFTGDIEKRTEQQLLIGYGRQLDADVLIVPHHGSKTSSTPAFITAVDPEISIFSVGYKNKFKFPNDKVMARYERMEGTLLQTDKSGALSITLNNKTALVSEKYREKVRKYWHHTGD